MCAHKTYQHVTGLELYQHYETVVIAFDIENITIVPNTRHGVERCSDVRKIIPFGSFSLLVPVFQHTSGTGIGSVIFN